MKSLLSILVLISAVIMTGCAGPLSLREQPYYKNIECAGKLSAELELHRVLEDEDAQRLLSAAINYHRSFYENTRENADAAMNQYVTRLRYYGLGYYTIDEERIVECIKMYDPDFDN